jgi:hypothetical protein
MNEEMKKKFQAYSKDDQATIVAMVLSYWAGGEVFPDESPEGSIELIREMGDCVEDIIKEGMKV